MLISRASRFPDAPRGAPIEGVVIFTREHSTCCPSAPAPPVYADLIGSAWLSSGVIPPLADPISRACYVRPGDEQTPCCGSRVRKRDEFPGTARRVRVRVR